MERTLVPSLAGPGHATGEQLVVGIGDSLRSRLEGEACAPDLGHGLAAGEGERVAERLKLLLSVRSKVLEGGGELLDGTDDPRSDVLDAGEVEFARGADVLELGDERLDKLGRASDALYV